MMLQCRIAGLGKPSSKGQIGILGLVLLFLLLCAKVRGQQSITLAWNPDADPSVAGYALYYGTASHDYSTRIDAGTNITASVSNLLQGPTYYFAATAYDTNGVESPPSNEVSYNVPVTTGSLLVTLIPAGAISAGAQWQLDGGAFQSSGILVSGLSPGNHTVTFNTISGWNTPASQTVTLVAGVTNSVTGAYTVQPAGLQVTLSPAGAISAGAQWQVDGGAFQSSGTVVSTL